MAKKRTAPVKPSKVRWDITIESDDDLAITLHGSARTTSAAIIDARAAATEATKLLELEHALAASGPGMGADGGDEDGA